MQDTRENITRNVNAWVINNIGPKFAFREFQLETIVDIIYNILKGEQHNQIIEAPTGSGKSLINIISAGVLADIYGLTSYILVSDLYLWKQYEEFVVKHYSIHHKFGIIKGQTGNYVCEKNKQDMRNAHCRMAGIPWATLFSNAHAKKIGYECAKSCPYVKARKHAIQCKVVIMTYALYHYMVNIVSPQSSSPMVFRNRDIIFCDECHNIPNLISNNFTPVIRESDLDKFKKLQEYVIDYRNKQADIFNENDKSTESWPNYSDKELTDIFYNQIFNEFCDVHDKYNVNKKALDAFFDLLSAYKDVIDTCESELSTKKLVDNKEYDENDISYYKACSWFRNTLCFWNDFMTAINETGIEYFLKNVTENNNTHTKDIEFKCVKEDYICWKFLLSTATDRVMLSATIGGIEPYIKNTGIRYSNELPIFNRIPSTFNFEKSPIHFLNRYKMSYRQKEQSFPYIKNIIYSLLNNDMMGKRGLIQTGSYANAKEIYDSAPPNIRCRMLLYTGSKEKTNQIALYKMMKDAILVGPTLVEGIDLPDDLCRFIIIVKMPYPVITDDYVKRKMELFPLWYNSTTSNTIIQGIGRGIRNDKDYCITYILDACFLSLYNATQDQYPPELQNRIKIYA